MKENISIPATVMFMGLLHSPCSDSHQYTPLSDERAFLIVHTESRESPKPPLHGWDVIDEMFLFSVQPVEFNGSAQLRETRSYSKNWDLSGWMLRLAAGDTNRK